MTARLHQGGIWSFPRGTKACLRNAPWAVEDTMRTALTPAEQDRVTCSRTDTWAKSGGGGFETITNSLWRNLPHDKAMTKESAAASRRSSHGLDQKNLDKLTRNIDNFTPSMPNNQNVQAYLQDIDFHLEMWPNVTDKDRLLFTPNNIQSWSAQLPGPAACPHKDWLPTAPRSPR